MVNSTGYSSAFKRTSYILSHHDVSYSTGYRRAFVDIAVVRISNCLCAYNVALWPAFIDSRLRRLPVALVELRGVVRSRRMNDACPDLRVARMRCRDRCVALYGTHLLP